MISNKTPKHLKHLASELYAVGLVLRLEHEEEEDTAGRALTQAESIAQAEKPGQNKSADEVFNALSNAVRLRWLTYDDVQDRYCTTLKGLGELGASINYYQTQLTQQTEYLFRSIQTHVSK